MARLELFTSSVQQPTALVRLSERNLATLTHKICVMEDSARTLFNHDVHLDGSRAHPESCLTLIGMPDTEWHQPGPAHFSCPLKPGNNYLFWATLRISEKGLHSLLGGEQLQLETGDWNVTVVLEPDEEHYRDRAACEMHPETEAFIARR